MAAKSLIDGRSPVLSKNRKVVVGTSTSFRAGIPPSLTRCRSHDAAAGVFHFPRHWLQFGPRESFSSGLDEDHVEYHSGPLGAAFIGQADAAVQRYFLDGGTTLRTGRR
jgi:hypothetical protein